MKASQRQTQDIPSAFLDRMAALLGDEFPAFLASLQHPSITGLRVNTLKLSPSEFSQKSPWRISAVPWCPTGFLLDTDQGDRSTLTPGKHPYHAAGLYYLQEPSAMAAAEILDPQPGEAVLDLAAAPGGKATHLASLMDNQGLLVANEIHPRRAWDLAENLERCGVTNAIVTNETPERLADHFGPYFDRLLLDAPCSGEGMFRKGDIARQEWKPALVQSCAIRQSSILEQAARLVKPGGHLAYTTCTFSPNENEGVLARFLAHHPEFDLVDIPHTPGFSHARPGWTGLSADDRLKGAVRIWPHHTQAEGHFIALLVKQGSTSNPDGDAGIKKGSQSRARQQNISGKASLRLWESFCHDHLALELDPSRLACVGAYVYLLPNEAPDLAGLRAIHPGWWLGSIQKDRFIPSHALAMAINRQQARHSISFVPDDPQLHAYFSGQSLINPGENAWVLLTVDGYPVGWGKRVQNVLKNYYPRGLRRLK